MSSAGVTPLTAWARKHARIRNEYITGFIGEYFGTLLLCLFVFGASASVGINGAASGGHVAAVFGSVFGIMTSITIFGGLSGAHLNPAVSLGLTIAGHVSWLKLPVLWTAQILGAYSGAGLGYSIYKYKLEDAFWKAGPVADQVYYAAIGGFFSHAPSSPVGTCILDQTITTAVLVAATLSAVDHRNMKIPHHFFGLLFAYIVAAVAFCFGVNAGGSMNPARDLGPRLMAVTIGCDSDSVFKYGNEHYWLGTLFGPLIGAALGAFFYVFFVGSHLKETDEELAKEKGDAGSGDWRSTVFLPKAGQPSAPQNYNNNNGAVNGGLGPYVNGVQNPGYIREDPRRQY